MAHQWSGWVLAGETSLAFYGGYHQYEYRDPYGLVQAGDNLLQIAVMSDGRPVGVTISLEEELPPVDLNDRWESIAETSVSFAEPPAFGRFPDESREGDSDPVFATLDIPAGMYRVRCSSAGLAAAEQERIFGDRPQNPETPSIDWVTLPEQIKVMFAPATDIDPRQIIRRSRPDYPL